MAPKAGDVVEVLIRSRRSPTGQTWVPAVIESITEPDFKPPLPVNAPPYVVVNVMRNPNCAFVRVRTLCGDLAADALTYLPHQIKRLNLLQVIALASADFATPGVGPYEAPIEYDGAPYEQEPKPKDTDPEEIVDRIARLDFARNAGRPKPVMPPEEEDS